MLLSIAKSAGFARAHEKKYDRGASDTEIVIGHILSYAGVIPTTGRCRSLPEGGASLRRVVVPLNVADAPFFICAGRMPGVRVT